MTFSEHITELRESRGFLQKDIAAALGVSLHTYQRYEYAEAEPKISGLITLADLYGMSLDELVCRERPKRVKKKAGN